MINRITSIDLGRGPCACPAIMAIINATPDSFSDGGRYRDASHAAEVALQYVDEGARIIDIGAESTRPGARRIAPDEQIRRAVPVIRAIRNASSIAISIDTTRADVAEAAIDAGADVINDVSAGRDDERAMFTLAAQRDVPLILMHMLNSPATMQHNPQYEDVVNEVASFLAERAERARELGVNARRIMLDPGIGFGKTTEHNLTLLRHLERFTAMDYPILLGASRKRFVGQITEEPEPADRVAGTLAITTWAVMQGVAMIRVHDVKPNVQAMRMALAIREEKWTDHGPAL